MITKNNPITAEITVSYDNDASHRNFEEQFQLSPLLSNNNRGGDVFQYIDYGNIKLIDRIEDLFTIKTKSRHILYQFVEWINEEDRKNYTIEELHEEILSYYNFDDLEDFAENKLEGIKIERHYILHETRGYSQGDWAYALIPTDELREVWGNTNTPDEELVSTEYIDNLFWDSPIWGRIEIFASQDYSFELYEIEDIPEYLNYPQDIDFVNEKILEFIGDKFKNVPALKNILDAVKNALPDEIHTPRYC